MLSHAQWKPDLDVRGAATSKELDKLVKRVELRITQEGGIMDARRYVAIRKRHVAEKAV